MMQPAGVLLALTAGLVLVACDTSPRTPAETTPSKSRASSTLAPVAAVSSPSPSPSRAPSPLPLKVASPLRLPVEPEPTPTAPSPTPSTDQASPKPGSTSPPTSTPTSAPRSYPPRDECAALPGFAAFRGKVAAALRTRDAAALAALADPAVKLDFGGGAGRDELRRRLAQTRPELWGEIGKLLTLGCAVDGGLVTMPWIFSRMPSVADPYRGMLALGDVAVRERAAPDAPLKGELDWALVEPVGARFDLKARYVEVETVGKSLRGYVERGKLRSLLDYRMIVERQGEGWAITAFIAGD